jgi:hypothetical protein
VSHFDVKTGCSVVDCVLDTVGYGLKNMARKVSSQMSASTTCKISKFTFWSDNQSDMPSCRSLMAGRTYNIPLIIAVTNCRPAKPCEMCTLPSATIWVAEECAIYYAVRPV